MARRIGALFCMAVLLLLVHVLVFEVYRHHEEQNETDEPAVVRLDDPTA